MAFQTVSIKSARKGTPPLIMEVFVHKALDSDVFLVGDKSGHIPLSIEEDPTKGKNLKIGNFYRLIRPIIIDGILKLQKISPLPIEPFKYAPLKPDAPTSYSPSLENMKTFDDIGELKPSTVIPNIVAKVVYVSPEKQSKFSKFRSVAIKDVKNNKNFVSLYGTLAEQVKQDTVYSFKNLVIQVGNKCQMDL